MYFYTEIVTTDALGGEVRTMIVIHKKDDLYNVNFNTSDFILAINSQAVYDFTSELTASLNNKLVNKYNNYNIKISKDLLYCSYFISINKLTVF